LADPQAVVTPIRLAFAVVLTRQLFALGTLSFQYGLLWLGCHRLGLVRLDEVWNSRELRLGSDGASITVFVACG
jgi:hypothetical protein